MIYKSNIFNDAQYSHVVFWMLGSVYDKNLYVSVMFKYDTYRDLNGIDHIITCVLAASAVALSATSAACMAAASDSADNAHARASSSAVRARSLLSCASLTSN